MAVRFELGGADVLLVVDVQNDFCTDARCRAAKMSSR